LIGTDKDESATEQIQDWEAYFAGVVGTWIKNDHPSQETILDTGNTWPNLPLKMTIRENRRIFIPFLAA